MRSVNEINLDSNWSNTRIGRVLSVGTDNNLLIAWLAYQ